MRKNTPATTGCRFGRDGWPYECGTVGFVARLTDTSGNVWTDTYPLSEKP